MYVVTMVVTKNFKPSETLINKGLFVFPYGLQLVKLGLFRKSFFYA